MKRKILIATPIKGGISARYQGGFLEILRKKDPELELDYCFHEGTSINFARNECCHYAIKIGAREIVFIDEDMGFYHDEHWVRILSHVDVDIVAGLYCKKFGGDPTWLLNLKDGYEIDPKTGLCEVEEIACGFMKVRVDTVLTKMVAGFPELEYYVKFKGENDPGDRNTCHEFFPMGVLGPRSHGARLERVKMELRRFVADQTKMNPVDVLANIEEACFDEQKPGNLFGEDYYFCRQARACGIKIHADFGMAPVPHIGRIPFPITPDMVGIDPKEHQAIADRVKAMAMKNDISL